MEFNLTRLSLLLKRQFLGSGKKYITGIAIGTGVVLMISLASVFLGGVAQISQFYQSGLITYIIGGVIVSSMAFAEINKPETGYQLMTLPASSLEKFASTWLFTSVIYSLMAFVVLTLGACFLYVLGLFDLPIEGGMFNTNEMWMAFKQYFIGNTIFLAGAAAFKRNAFFKTLLSVMVVFIFFGIYGAILAKMIWLPNMANNSMGSGIVINHTNFGGGIENIFGSTETALLAFKAFIAIFFLSLGFYKFKEREL
jgi:hypothetical protein